MLRFGKEAGVSSLDYYSDSVHVLLDVTKLIEINLDVGFAFAPCVSYFASNELYPPPRGSPPRSWRAPDH